MVGAVVAAVVMGAMFAARAKRNRAAGGTSSPAAAFGRVDPFTLGEPWRNHVAAALSAQRRFDRLVADTQPGPLRDRLVSIGRKVDQGVRDCYQIGQHGHALDAAIRALDAESLHSRLQVSDDPVVRTSIESQLASIERIRVRRDATDERLRVLQTRMGELASQAAEVSAGVDHTEQLGTALDDVVQELEALRLAVAEIEGAP